MEWTDIEGLVIDNPHPVNFVDLVRRRIPFFLFGRPNKNAYTPEILTSNNTELNIEVNMDAITFYVKGLRLGEGYAQSLFGDSVIDRLSTIRLDFYEDHYIGGRGPLGTNLTILDQALLDVIVDPQHRDKPDGNPYTPDSSWSEVLTQGELEWCFNFWEGYDSRNPATVEIEMNITALHEVRHIVHQIEDKLALVVLINQAGKRPGFLRMPGDAAWDLVHEAVEELKLPYDFKENDADLYAIRTFRLIREQGFPKIIHLNPAK